MGLKKVEHSQKICRQDPDVIGSEKHWNRSGIGAEIERFRQRILDPLQSATGKISIE